MSVFYRIFDWFNSIEWKPDTVTAAATVVLAVLTLTLAGGTLGLWNATRRLVKGGERTAERQLRAYVCIEIGDAPIFKQDREIIVILRIVNRGATPAYNVEHKSIIGIETFPLTSDLPPTLGDDQPAHPVTLGPSASVQTVAVIPRALTQSERELLLHGSNRIYVWGTVTYLDAFGSNRFTNFRMMMPIEPDGTGGSVVSCDAGNDAN